jgi:hypothetical protein
VNLVGMQTSVRTLGVMTVVKIVPLTDSENETMRDINGEVIYRPKNVNISQIFRLGQSHADTPWTQMGTILQILFSHGGRYDFQRQGGDRHPQDTILPSGYLFHPEYVSFSTVAIGVFAKGAGISMNEILSIQNTFAGLRSSFAPGTQMDPVYRNLPALNVANTRLGFILARGN